MKLKIFGPERDPDGGGLSMTALAFTLSGPARVEVELEDGTSYSIIALELGDISYLGIKSPEGQEMVIAPEGKRHVLIKPR